MSDLGFLVKLLDGADVAWKPLGDLGELVRGNGLPKSDFTESGIPAIHYGQIYTFYGLFTHSTISFVSPETAAKDAHHLDDAGIAELASVILPAERKIQDYKSTYNDIRDWLRREREGKEAEESSIDWADVVFEVDLLKSQEINLDYILELIFEKNRNVKDKGDLIEEARRLIRASVGNRAKEGLIVDFINRTNLDEMDGKESVIEAFFSFAQEEQRREFEELVTAESLHPEAARRYVANSIKREFATENGDDLNSILPKMSPLNPAYLTKKGDVFKRVSDIVAKFKGVGGKI